MNERRLLSVLVENHPGVLNRVSSMIRRRGFNIDSLSVGETQDRTSSRMTIQVHVGKQQAAQASNQLLRLIDVISVEDITDEAVVAHELLIIKLCQSLVYTPALESLAKAFHARTLDLGKDSTILEVTGPIEKIERFIELAEPFEIAEIARSGLVAMVTGAAARLQMPEEKPRSAQLADHTGDV